MVWLSEWLNDAAQNVGASVGKLCLQVDPSDSPMSLAKHGLEMEKRLRGYFQKMLEKGWTEICLCINHEIRFNFEGAKAW
jgi:hypothetical protein